MFLSVLVDEQILLWRSPKKFVNSNQFRLLETNFCSMMNIGIACAEDW